MNKKGLLALPFILLNSAVIIAALFKAFQIGLGYYPLIGMKEVTLHYFKTVLTNPFLQHSFFYSLYLALTATVIALILGLGMAFALLQTKKRFKGLATFFQLPIALPHLIVALMIMQLFSQSGFFSRVLFQLGVIKEISQFPLLIHDKKGIGIILVFLYKEIPYVAVATLAILKQIDLGYVSVARNLGATKGQTFWKIVLPLLQPTLTTLFIILFCFTFSSFEVPYLLGSPTQTTIAVTAYDLFTQANLQIRSQAFALNILMSAVCLGVTLLALVISSKLPGGKGKRRNHEN